MLVVFFPQALPDFSLLKKDFIVNSHTKILFLVRQAFSTQHENIFTTNEMYFRVHDSFYPSADLFTPFWKPTHSLKNIKKFKWILHHVCQHASNSVCETFFLKDRVDIYLCGMITYLTCNFCILNFETLIHQ